MNERPATTFETQLHGVRLTLTAAPGATPHWSEVAALLADLLPDPAQDAATPCVQVRVGLPTSQPFAGVAWGRRLQADSAGRVRFDGSAFGGALPAGLTYTAAWRSPDLDLDVALPPPAARLLVRERLQPGRRSARLLAQAYALALFPLWVALEAARELHLLHAAAVRWQGPTGACGLLLAGLPGSGKTTLALGLTAALTAQQGQLLSDNLVLTDGRSVYAVPEPLHLGRASERLLPPALLERLTPLGASSYGRRERRLPPDLRAAQVRPQALILVRQGAALALEPLAPELAAARLSSFDLLARELQSYAAFAAPLSLSGPLSLTPAARLAAVAALSAALPAYVLTLAHGAPLAPALSRVQALAEAA